MSEHQGTPSTTLILNVPDQDVPKVLAAAGVSADQDDVAGFLAAPVVDGRITGTSCKVTSSGGAGNDFACADSD